METKGFHVENNTLIKLCYEINVIWNLVNQWEIQISA